jgi:hypothetical protein
MSQILFGQLPTLQVISASSTEASEQPAVILVAQAAYHLEELLPLVNQLHQRGKPCLVVAPIPPRRALQRWRPSVKRHKELLDAAPGPKGQLLTEIQLTQATALVVLNDWGTTASLVDFMKNQQVPTFAWVEGVQDFQDVDTGKQRQAYRSVDHVFCLGQYSYDALSGCSRTLTGSERLTKLWHQKPTLPQDKNLLVNLNFTYGVGEQHRRLWLKSVQKASRLAGWHYTISQHVADKGLVVPWHRSQEDVGTLLSQAPRFVTRFSTLGYEALVRGVAMTYHNPHGEKVPTFANPQGAFSLSSSIDELAKALREPPPSREEVRKQAEEFLHHHLHLERAESPAERAAKQIAAALEN